MDNNVSRRQKRNSSIELLRLFSMLMIVGFHYVLPNTSNDWLLEQPVSIAKFVYQFVYMGGGWVGNFIFLQFPSGSCWIVTFL